MSPPVLQRPFAMYFGPPQQPMIPDYPTNPGQSAIPSFYPFLPLDFAFDPPTTAEDQEIQSHIETHIDEHTAFEFRLVEILNDNYTLTPRDLRLHGYPMFNGICIGIYQSKYGQPSFLNDHADPKNKKIKTCERCRKSFKISQPGKYDRDEECRFHPGKLLYGQVYDCCPTNPNDLGCERRLHHVWRGLDDGYNAFLQGYRNTSESTFEPSTNEHHGIYALDCEMSYTMNGLELTKVTVVNTLGDPIVDQLVKPHSPIIDYNTRYSGITEEMLNGPDVKTLEEVQDILLEFINERTILIGHSLNCDLRALKLVHTRVVDTSVLFQEGQYKKSLRKIVLDNLGRHIQNSEDGHSSWEDSAATMDVILHNVRQNYEL